MKLGQIKVIQIFSKNTKLLHALRDLVKLPHIKIIERTFGPYKMFNQGRNEIDHSQPKLINKFNSNYINLNINKRVAFRKNNIELHI